MTWEPARDDEARERAGAVVISWSGLAYANCRVLDSARGSSVTKAFLDAGAAWLDLEPPLRWMSLATGIPLTLAPQDVSGATLSRQAPITVPMPVRPGPICRVVPRPPSPLFLCPLGGGVPPDRQRT